MSDRRENMRFKALGLKTAFGEVMDISDSGIGVFRKGKVNCSIGDQVKVFISHENTVIEAKARVVRINKVGMFRHEIGMEFVGITEDTLTQIWALTDMACSAYTGPRCYIAA
ncbi:MAG: PilZ domain-containing protein [Phycisphaeraceae bacterium]|jgi:c-di-GMP-binding flagellar brake protein YcgR